MISRSQQKQGCVLGGVESDENCDWRFSARDQYVQRSTNRTGSLHNRLWFNPQAGPDTGTVSQEAFDYLEKKLLNAVSSAGADGVLLHLHGAMVTEHYDDPESEVLKKTRQMVRDKVPIVLVHDLHGNISDSWLEYSNVIIGYKTSPHVDEFERGLEGGKVISRILKGHVKPTMALSKPPILIGGGLMTVVDQPLAMVKPPLYRLMSLARRMEQDDQVVNVTVAGGFGHSDVPRAGMGVVVTTNNNQELAEEKASELEKLASALRIRAYKREYTRTTQNLGKDLEQLVAESRSDPVFVERIDSVDLSKFAQELEEYLGREIIPRV